MEATTFDGISRNFGVVTSRRGFARLLGGAAVLGTVLATGSDSQAKRGGKRKKITICYLGQTRKVKKKKLGNFPGATKGACATGGNQGGNQGGGNQGGGQGAQVCTRWIISGSPNPSDRMAADDDLAIFNLSRGGQGILFGDNDRKASTYAPVPFEASIGDRLHIVAHDGGGCRSVSPLWLHCQTTGQKRQLYAGYSGVGCNYQAGKFVDHQVEVWI